MESVKDGCPDYCLLNPTICNQAMKPYDGDNDRFTMRIFMVRLGMKGTQFALARKLMMKNLTGGLTQEGSGVKKWDTPILTGVSRDYGVRYYVLHSDVQIWKARPL